MHLFLGYDKDNFFSINCFERNNAANTATIDSTTTDKTNNNTLTNATAPLEEQSEYIYTYYTYHISISARICTVYFILISTIK